LPSGETWCSEKDGTVAAVAERGAEREHDGGGECCFVEREGTWGEGEEGCCWVREEREMGGGRLNTGLFRRRGVPIMVGEEAEGAITDCGAGVGGGGTDDTVGDLAGSSRVFLVLVLLVPSSLTRRTLSVLSSLVELLNGLADTSTDFFGVLSVSLLCCNVFWRFRDRGGTGWTLS